MAKSLRSKWARARRRDKRKKYSNKEATKLQNLVKKREIREQILKDIELAVKKIKEEPGREARKTTFKVKLTSEYHPMTLRNKHGNLAPWLGSSARKKLKIDSGKKRRLRKFKIKR